MTGVAKRLQLSSLGFFIILLTGIIALVFPGGMACALTPASAEAEKVNMWILNNSIACIKANHPDAAAFLGNEISFVRSSSIGEAVDGYTGVTYTGGDWIISVGHAVVLNYVYSIRAENSKEKIVWVGTGSKAGQITEVTYTRQN